MSAVIEPEIVSNLPHHLIAGKAPILNGLTLKQTAFIDKYIETQNATEAVVFAYQYEDRQTASVKGSQLLRLGKVKAEVRRRLGNHIASSDEVLERLTTHARGDLTDVLQPDGSFNLRKARKSGASQLLKKLKIKRRYEKDIEGNAQPVDEYEYEIHDPQSALEKLGRFHALFTDRQQSELTLAPADIDRLGESLVSGLLEAAERRRKALNEASIEVKAENAP